MYISSYVSVTVACPSLLHHAVCIMCTKFESIMLLHYYIYFWPLLKNWTYCVHTHWMEFFYSLSPSIIIKFIYVCQNFFSVELDFSQCIHHIATIKQLLEGNLFSRIQNFKGFCRNLRTLILETVRSYTVFLLTIYSPSKLYAQNIPLK